MKVKLVAVGKLRGGLTDVAAEYLKRAGRYWRLELHEVRAGSANKAPDSVMEEEGKRLLGLCGPGAHVWLLTRDGKDLTSAALARRLEEHAIRSEREVTFLIGGAFGFAAAVRDRADSTLSLSAMTLPHELARVVLLEQLYRAGTILRGEPYHKGPSS